MNRTQEKTYKYSSPQALMDLTTLRRFHHSNKVTDLNQSNFIPEARTAPLASSPTCRGFPPTNRADYSRILTMKSPTSRLPWPGKLTASLPPWCITKMASQYHRVPPGVHWGKSTRRADDILTCGHWRHPECGASTSWHPVHVLTWPQHTFHAQNNH